MCCNSASIELATGSTCKTDCCVTRTQEGPVRGLSMSSIWISKLGMSLFRKVPVSLSQFWQDINRLLPFCSSRVAVTRHVGSWNLPLSGPSHQAHSVYLCYSEHRDATRGHDESIGSPWATARAGLQHDERAATEAPSNHDACWNQQQGEFRAEWSTEHLPHLSLCWRWTSGDTLSLLRLGKARSRFLSGDLVQEGCEEHVWAVSL